jgi:hypothetical protein
MSEDPRHDEDRLEPAPVESTSAVVTAKGPVEMGKQQWRQGQLHIRITDFDTGRLKVSLTLPAGLVGVALRQGARLIPSGHGSLDLVGAIERNELTAPLVVVDEQNGERVEISLE